MKTILSLGAVGLAFAIPAAAHAQSSSAPQDHSQHQAQASDPSRHQAEGSGSAQARPPTARHQQMGMNDCRCCCCEAMREKMRQHGQGSGSAPKDGKPASHQELR